MLKPLTPGAEERLGSPRPGRPGHSLERRHDAGGLNLKTSIGNWVFSSTVNGRFQVERMAPMISSVANQNTTLNVLNRSSQPLARAASAVSTAESAVLRAIDRIAGNERTGIELSQRQDDRAAVDPQRSGIQEMDQEDMAGDAAELIRQKTALRANVAVLKTSDRMVGTLLDIFG